MKLSCHALVLLIVTCTATRGTAAPITWALSPVSVQGCCLPPLNQQTAIVSGTFVFDFQTGTYSDWSFTISGFSDPLLPLNGVLTPTNSSVIVGDPTLLDLSYAMNQAQLTLTFAYLNSFGGLVEVPLTSFGGDVPVLVTDSPSFVSFSAFAQTTATGQNITSSIPEPLAGMLVFVGAAVLCLSKSRLFLCAARARTAKS